MSLGTSHVEARHVTQHGKSQDSRCSRALVSCGSSMPGIIMCMTRMASKDKFSQSTLLAEADLAICRMCISLP